MDKSRHETTPSITGLLHDLKKSLRPDVHSLEEVRMSLREIGGSDTTFIDLLEIHHDFLEESIAVLMDAQAEVDEKQYHLDRFIKLLEMHGRAEQETLYLHLKDNPEKAARLEGFAGQDEHDIAFQISDELREMQFENDWSEEADAKAKVLANLVQQHIKEEESHMFPIARKNIPRSELAAMKPDYIEGCQGYLDSSSQLNEEKFTN